MTASPPPISVVICAYNEARWDYLAKAVSSVQLQSVLPLEIIVVIDYNPTLLERVRANMPGVVAIENREARGLNGARNSGIAVSKGSVVAFLDDDAVATPQWIEQLTAGYYDPAVMGVGGAIEPIWQGGGRPAWFPEEFDWVVGCSYRGMSQESGAVRNLIGCNMSFRRHIFDMIGNFRLGYGCDETEFCIRMHQRLPKKVLQYRRLAKVYHHVPANRTTWSYFRSRCYFEGRSKVDVSQLVGAKDALSSEWKYTLRTIPQAIMRNVADGLFRRKPSSLLKAGAIVAGLAVTTSGYIGGIIARQRVQHKNVLKRTMQYKKIH